MIHNHKNQITWEKPENQNSLKSLKTSLQIIQITTHGKKTRSKIYCRCVKLRENQENQSFTFFAFLLPYLGVSDSLAYFKRRGLKRSIVWYKKFLISCLVARYSAVFVLKSMEIYGSRRLYGSMFKCKVFCVRWSIRDA